MKTLLVAASVVALSNTVMAAELDEKVSYPKTDAGFTRQVIHLSKQDAEDTFRVEIITGEALRVDCNQQHSGGELEEHTLKGWGYSYHRLDKVSGSMSTTTVCPGQKKEQRFIPVVGEGFLLYYNSKLLTMVYVPRDVEACYRVWSATEKVEKAVGEWTPCMRKPPTGDFFVAPAPAQRQADAQAGVHGDPAVRGLPILYTHHLLGYLVVVGPIALHRYHL